MERYHKLAQPLEPSSLHSSMMHYVQQPLHTQPPISSRHSSPIQVRIEDLDEEQLGRSTRSSSLDGPPSKRFSAFVENSEHLLNWQPITFAQSTTKEVRTLDGKRHFQSASQNLESNTSPSPFGLLHPKPLDNESHNQATKSSMPCDRCCQNSAERQQQRAQRRREQNRASQRKFRDNKNARIRQAEDLVLSLQDRLDTLERRNSELEKDNAELEMIRQLVNSRSGSTIPESEGQSPIASTTKEDELFSFLSMSHPGDLMSLDFGEASSSSFPWEVQNR